MMYKDKVTTKSRDNLQKIYMDGVIEKQCTV